MEKAGNLNDNSILGLASDQNEPFLFIHGQQMNTTEVLFFPCRGTEVRGGGSGLTADPANR